ncbi:MAG: Asp-tRNA(Asn)/Glu-tRNA(Gln) amidotransferase subunit GatC [candidate division WOR-3 bacterium]|nr:Asp-tRNA(Asn)/Glu-tRNA(Gln) amidotransferase subunit GatC [candidate division WOR-3 bacterium]
MQNRKIMITQSDLEKIAKLARLGLKPNESAELTNDIEKIISYFQQLSKLNLTNIKPMTHAVQTFLPLRSDEIKATKCLVDYLPYKKFNYIFVPPVLE